MSSLGWLLTTCRPTQRLTNPTHDYIIDWCIVSALGVRHHMPMSLWICFFLIAWQVPDCQLVQSGAWRLISISQELTMFFSYVSTIGQLFSHTSTTPSNVVATSTVEFHQLSAGPCPSIPLQYVRRRDHLRCGEGRDLMVNCFGKQCEAQQICTACRSKTRVINSHIYSNWFEDHSVSI